jgi:hypothetical protein
VQPGHEIALARRGLEHLHFGFAKAGRAQARRHRVRRASGIAGRRRCVDFNKLLVDVEGQLLPGIQGFRAHRRPPGNRNGDQHRGGQSGLGPLALLGSIRQALPKKSANKGFGHVILQEQDPMARPTISGCRFSIAAAREQAGCASVDGLRSSRSAERQSNC